MMTKKRKRTEDKRKQINVRLDDAAHAELAELMGWMRDALGIRIGMTDVVLAGVAELRKRYQPKGGGDK